MAGIVRKVDDLGRIVLPKELRTALRIEYGDPLEIFVRDEHEIVLGRYRPGCVFCGELDAYISHQGHRLCRRCTEAITRAGEAAAVAE